MILVISNEADSHAVAVRRSLNELGAESLLLDLSEFPRQSELSVAYGPGSDRRHLMQTPRGLIDFRQCGAIWWRRPQPIQIDAGITDPSYVNFAYSESTEAICGLWQSLDAFWINEPARDIVASRKVYQLRLAQEIGLPIPDTLVTGNARIEEVKLPPRVMKALRLLMRRLGLVYGAIDMRLTPDGEYIFLEINPAGQWLFIEAMTQQTITQDLAKLLVARDVQFTSRQKTVSAFASCRPAASK